MLIIADIDPHRIVPKKIDFNKGHFVVKDQLLPEEMRYIYCLYPEFKKQNQSTEFLSGMKDETEYFMKTFAGGVLYFRKNSPG